MSPSIQTFPPVSSGSEWPKYAPTSIVLPASDEAKPIVYVPGSLFVASIASRSEIVPSAPGFARRSATEDVSPSRSSELAVTVIGIP
jgi:hypothetical protein